MPSPRAFLKQAIEQELDLKKAYKPSDFDRHGILKAKLKAEPEADVVASGGLALPEEKLIPNPKATVPPPPEETPVELDASLLPEPLVADVSPALPAKESKVIAKPRPGGRFQKRAVTTNATTDDEERAENGVPGPSVGSLETDPAER